MRKINQNEKRRQNKMEISGVCMGCNKEGALKHIWKTNQFNSSFGKSHFEGYCKKCFKIIKARKEI